MIEKRAILIIIIVILTLSVVGCSFDPYDESYDSNIESESVIFLNDTKEKAMDSDIPDIEQQLFDIKNFASENYNIRVNLYHVFIDSREEIIGKDTYRVLAAILDKRDTMRVYISNATNMIAGVKFGDEELIMFENDFESSFDYANEIMYSYREDSLKSYKKYPLLFEDGSYRYEFNRIVDLPYYIYIDAIDDEDRLFSFQKMPFEDDDEVLYDVVEREIDNGENKYDSKYALRVAKKIAVTALDMDRGTLQVNLASEKLELPAFTDRVYYSDICWLIEVSDKDTSYKVYVSAKTGEVCEIMGEYIEDSDDLQPIQTYEAENIAKHYFETISPEKLKNHIFIGYSSIYANGWTAFQYARVDGDTVYINETMVVYLNIDGTLNSFYQSVRLED